MILFRIISGMGTAKSEKASANEEVLALAAPRMSTNPATRRRMSEKMYALKRSLGEQATHCPAPNAIANEGKRKPRAGHKEKPPASSWRRSEYKSHAQRKGISKMCDEVS